MPTLIRPGRSWGAAPPRRGITRVGIVVLFCMSLVLTGLAVVLVQQLRERGNQATCKNNLREMGVAIFLYRNQVRPHALPPSRIADGYGTWAVLLGPYLSHDLGKGLSDWDTSRTYFQQPAEVRRVQVRFYYCPSRRSPGAESISGDVADPKLAGGRNYPGALSDYACASGDGNPGSPWTGPQANGSIIPARFEEGPDHGLRSWQGQTDFWLGKAGDKIAVGVRKGAGPAERLHDQLARGTSTTILLGEKHVPRQEFGRAEAGDGSVYDGARPASSARIGGSGHGLARSPEEPLDLAFPIFGSYHPGICHFLMADGSALAVSVTISPDVLGRQMVRGEE